MPGGIVHKLTPEQEELDRKREELSAVRTTLAERELELADLRAQLKSFEGRYLRQVGVLYAELDDWDARIAKLKATWDTSHAAQQRAEQARQRADETHEAAHGEASRARDFQPTASMKTLFRDVAKRIHPDFAKDEADQERRTRLMAQANEAYNRGDAEALQHILDDYDESGESVQGEGIGSALIRIIRQIHQAKKNIAAIEQELIDLRASEFALLKRDVEAAQQQGRDLLVELATTLNQRIGQKRKEYETLAKEVRGHGR